MTENSFSDFYKSLLELVKTFENKNTLLKVEEDLESSIIRIFGENISSLGRAKTGLGDISELAYTTAEHHPYWGLLYHCSQIAETALEKWEGQLSQKEIDEIKWSIDELKNVCDKLRVSLDEKMAGKDK